MWHSLKLEDCVPFWAQGVGCCLGSNLRLRLALQCPAQAFLPRPWKLSVISSPQSCPEVLHSCLIASGTIPVPTRGSIAIAPRRNQILGFS